MSKSRVNEVGHVRIGQRIPHVSTFTLSNEEPFGAQHPQPLRDGAHPFAGSLGQLAHTKRPSTKTHEQRKPSHVPCRTKESRRRLQGTSVEMDGLGMMVRHLTRRIVVDVTYRVIMGLVVEVVLGLVEGGVGGCVRARRVGTVHRSLK